MPEATKVHMHLAKAGPKIMITVEDNSREFDYTNPNIFLNAISLSSIRNRIKLLDGTINIISNVGSGTIVEIDLKMI